MIVLRVHLGTEGANDSVSAIAGTFEYELQIRAADVPASSASSLPALSSRRKYDWLVPLFMVDMKIV